MGRIRIKGQTEPATPPADYIELYIDENDLHLKTKDENGDVVDYTGSATGIASASNVGAGGVGVFKQVAGTDLEFKKINAGSSKVTITDDTGNNEVDIDVAPGNIAITDLSGYDANKYVDHTTVSINAGTGLTGGGTIATNRTISLDIDGLTAETSVASGDEIAIYDVSASAHRKMTRANFLAGLTSSVTSASNENVDGVGVFKQLSGTNLEFKGIKSESSSLSVTNDATNNTVDLTINDAFIDHDALTNFIADEHINWKSTSENLTTTGTVDAGKVLVGPSGSGTEELQVVSSGTRNGLGMTTAGTGDAINIIHGSTGDIIDAGTPFKVSASGAITSDTLTASRVLVSDASKVVTASSVTSTTLGFLDATSSVQTQLNGKISSSRQVATATGLTGGGDLSNNRTIALDFTSLSTDTLAGGDEFAWYDISASSHKKATWAKLNTMNSQYGLENVGLTAVHSAGTILITMHGADGTALSSSNPARIAFRSTTATSGTYTLLEITSNLTLTVSSGATLGCAAINSTPDSVNIYLVYDGSSPQLAVCRSEVQESEGLVSTTVMNSSSDDRSTIYSTTAVSNVAIRYIGHMRVYESTWGTWTTNPSLVAVNNGSNFAWRSGYASASKSSGQTISASTTTIIDFDGTSLTKNITITTGASWNALILHAGIYWVQARVTAQSATWGAGNVWGIYVYVNGSQRDIIYEEISRTYTGKRQMMGIGMIRCDPGDKVDVRFFTGQSGGCSLTTSGNENYVKITKVHGWDH